MPYTNSSPSLPFSEPTTSRDAALKARRFVGKQGRDVLAWFRERGSYGGTQKEAAAALDIGRASICARVNALEKAGQLVKSITDRREACSVYFINER